MELSPYAEARIALAKFKIIVARFEIVNQHLMAGGGEMSSRGLEEAQRSMAEVLPRLEEAIDETLDEAELRSGVAEANKWIELMNPTVSALIQEFAPGF